MVLGALIDIGVNPEAVRAAFLSRFDWDIGAADEDGPYDALVEVIPEKWLMGDPR